MSPALVSSDILKSSIFAYTIVGVKEFIRCRRYETLTLHYILQGFSTSDCDWLMPPGQAGQRQTRVPVTDALKRRELLEEFIFWYFDSFLLPLLKVSLFGLLTKFPSWMILFVLLQDNILYHGNICVPQSGFVFSARWLGDTLCSFGQPSDFWDIRKDAAGDLVQSSHHLCCWCRVIIWVWSRGAPPATEIGFFFCSSSTERYGCPTYRKFEKEKNEPNCLSFFPDSEV